MSKSFEEVMQLTRNVSSATALDDAEAKGLYDAILQIPHGGLAVEVGCQLGRSSSIFAQLSLGNQFNSIHIDPYTSQPEYAAQWLNMMREVGGDFEHSFTLLCMRTEQAAWHLEKFGPIDLAFIDGDHEYPGVMVDLNLVASKIKSGGLLTMHDYGRDSLPGVFQAASDYITDDKWEHIGTYGTLGVWRRK